MFSLRGDIEMPATKDSIADLRRDIVTVVYEQADTAVPVHHNLGRKPTGWLKIHQSKAMSIYQTADDESRTTDKVIYTRSTATGTARIEVL